MRLYALLRIGSAIGLALLLSGCSGNTDQWQWPGSNQSQSESGRSLPPLEVPPDLSSAALKESLIVPEGAAGDGQSAVKQRRLVLPDVSGIQVRRIGDERWLEIDMPPEQLWDSVRDFWVEQGFVISVEEPKAGLIQTDWVEERVAPSQGFFESLFSSLSNIFQGAVLRDRYRTRFERGQKPDTTEIYVSHNGIELVILTDSRISAGVDRSQSKHWQPRESDPELEAIMLRRLIVFLGPDEEQTEQQAEQLIADAVPRSEQAQMRRDEDGPFLTLPEGFSRAWQRVGLVLDRAGFTVADKDQSQGVFYVRYTDPDATTEKGFLESLIFWNDDQERSEEGKYLIVLRANADQTDVAVLDSQKNRDLSSTAARILGLLYEQLK